jgi:hypothetical protein
MFQDLIEGVRYCIEGDPVMVTDPKTGKKVEFKGKFKKVDAGPDVPHRFLRHGGKQGDQQAVSAGGRRRRKAGMAEEVDLIRGLCEGNRRPGRKTREDKKGERLGKRYSGLAKTTDGGGIVSLSKERDPTGGRRRAMARANSRTAGDVSSTRTITHLRKARDAQ